MNELKSIAIWFYIGVTILLFFLISMPIIFLTLPFDFKRKIPHFVGNVLCKILTSTPGICDFKIIKKIPLTPNKPYILVANHQSLTDAIVIGNLFYNFKWVSKYSVSKVPIIGFFINLCGYISLVRGDKESIAKCFCEAKYWLSQKVPVFFMPEGTRSVDGKVKEFKTGAFRIAIETNTEIVPISISGAGDLIAKGSWKFSKKAPIKIYVDDPVSPAHYSPDTLDDFINSIRSKIIKNLEKIK